MSKLLLTRNYCKILLSFCCIIVTDVMTFWYITFISPIQALVLHITKIGKFLRKRRSSNIFCSDICVYEHYHTRYEKTLQTLHTMIPLYIVHEPRVVVVNTNKFSLRQMFQRSTSRTLINFILRYQSDSRQL